MFRFLEIIWSSLKMALQEFRSNKLRTFLSLLGITFGIFCIISVLSTIGSMEVAIQKDIKALGSNTVYIDKWDYSGGDDYPWWKYQKRPSPKHEELAMLRAKVPTAQNIAFNISTTANIEFEDDVLTNVNYYGITEDFINIQPVEVLVGRYLIQSDYDYASNAVVIGFVVAEKMFGNAEKAFGKQIKLRNGKKGVIVGVLRKQGSSIIGGWDFDNSMVMPYGFMKQLIREDWANPVIMVQGQDKVPMEALRDELAGAMRSIRKLKPTEEDDFSLNDVDAFSDMMSALFGGVNQGGWFIAGLSLIVGMFGVANIMFVTVRERTSQIGLKKAIGAKRSTILTEFLLESAFLCIIGGLIGLILVFILTLIFSSLLGFPVFVSLDTILLAVGICIVVGVAAGIIPATIAARMDPVVAIRSK
jgi:putative ABC transport system permease protein